MDQQQDVERDQLDLDGDLMHGEHAAVEHGARARGPAPSMLGQAAAQIGPALLQRKVARRASGRGGHRNVEMGNVNHQHTDHFSNGKTDPNRVTVGHHRVHTVRKTEMVKNDGTHQTHVGAHVEVRINAGAITTIHFPADEHRDPAVCVLVFDINGHSGWIPVRDLEHHDQLAAAQRTIAHRVEHEQHRDGADRYGKAVRVKPHAPPRELASLHTMPHQTTGANMASHYFERPGHVVNLLVNLPNTGGTRVGVADDVLAAGTVFHRAENVAEVRIPLWHHGAQGARSNHTIHFIYGYAQAPGGEKRHGWINRAMVPGA